MMMPNRSYSATNSYRYGFNGKENDNEVKGEGNEQNYGMRVYDTRLGRFLSVDPLQAKFADLTPYQFASNSPVESLDQDGLERISQKLVMQNSKPVLSTISEGPKTRSFWQKIVDGTFQSKIPLEYDVEFKGETYKFSPDYEKLGNGLNPVYSLTDYNKFITNPKPDDYASVDEAGDEFNRNVIAGAIIYNATELTTRGHAIYTGFSWRGKYTVSSTDKASQAVHNDNLEATNSNAARQTIRNIKTDPQEGSSFGSQSYTLSNGKINLNARAVTNGTFDFVVTDDGRLVIGSGHYNLSNKASTVQAAGQMSIYKGKVTNVNNSSGHYQPTIQQAEKFGDILKKAGVDVSGAKLNLYNDKGVKVETKSL